MATGDCASQCGLKNRMEEGKGKLHGDLGKGWRGWPPASAWWKDSCWSL